MRMRKRMLGILLEKPRDRECNLKKPKKNGASAGGMGSRSITSNKIAFSLRLLVLHELSGQHTYPGFLLLYIYIHIHIYIYVYSQEGSRSRAKTNREAIMHLIQNQFPLVLLYFYSSFIFCCSI